MKLRKVDPVDPDTPADESFENWHLLEDNESEEEVEIAPLPQGGFAAQLAPPPPMEIDDVMEDAREDGANEDAEDVQQPAPPVPNAPLSAPENGVALHPVPPLRHSITQMVISLYFDISNRTPSALFLL